MVCLNNFKIYIVLISKKFAKVVDIVTILVHATGISEAKGVNDAAIGFDELALDSVLLALVVEGVDSGSEVICEEIPAI